jgi:hypothetical protein
MPAPQYPSIKIFIAKIDIRYEICQLHSIELTHYLAGAGAWLEQHLKN